LVSDVAEFDGSVVTYNYDPLFRLVSEQRAGSYGYSVSYEYDAAGNRLAKVWDGQRTDYVYDAADRLQFYVKPDGSVVAYEWDGNGNMVARTEGDQTTQFDYDYDNRLVKITYPDGSVVQFGYDGLGRRVFRQEVNVVRQFYFDGDRIIAEREGNAWVVRYLLGLRPSGFMANGQVRVYHADRLGSVRWVTDGSQNILVSYVYEGFGKIVGQNGGGGGPYQFCGLWGYRNDQDAGLMHVGARYYEFEIGRFVQKDPVHGFILEPLSLNCYIYCNNDPINKIDPNGQDPQDPDAPSLWDWIKKIKGFYDKITDFLSDVAIKWYVLLKDAETMEAMRRMLKEWRPRRDDIDWSIFSPLLKSHIQDSMKDASETAVSTMKFIYKSIVQ